MKVLKRKNQIYQNTLVKKYRAKKTYYNSLYITDKNN